MWLEDLSNEVGMATIQLVIGWKLAIVVRVLLLYIVMTAHSESLVISSCSRKKEKQYRE